MTETEDSAGTHHLCSPQGYRLVPLPLPSPPLLFAIRKVVQQYSHYYTTLWLSSEPNYYYTSTTKEVDDSGLSEIHRKYMGHRGSFLTWIGVQQLLICGRELRCSSHHVVRRSVIHANCRINLYVFKLTTLTSKVLLKWIYILSICKL